VETDRNVRDNSLWQIVPDSRSRMSEGVTRKSEFDSVLLLQIFFRVTEAVETVHRVGPVQIDSVESV
jgi:hypothetical protein